MQSVISDTTALIILAKSDKLELLSNLFEVIYIPEAVKEELDFKDDIVKYRIDRFETITIQPVTNREILTKIQKLNIDRGEVEAISLALELNLRLIIDERKGRKIAITQGLKVIGALGILIENYRQNFISLDETRYCFNLFKKSGLRISESLELLFFEKLKE